MEEKDLRRRTTWIDQEAKTDRGLRIEDRQRAAARRRSQELEGGFLIRAQV